MNHTLFFLSFQIPQNQNTIKAFKVKSVTDTPDIILVNQRLSTHHFITEEMSVSSPSQEEMFVNGYFKIVFKRQHFLRETIFDENSLINNNIFVWRGGLFLF